jgi:hypothetical protein
METISIESEVDKGTTHFNIQKINMMLDLILCVDDDLTLMLCKKVISKLHFRMK